MFTFNWSLTKQVRLYLEPIICILIHFIKGKGHFNFWTHFYHIIQGINNIIVVTVSIMKSKNIMINYLPNVYVRFLKTRFDAQL